MAKKNRKKTAAEPSRGKPSEASSTFLRTRFPFFYGVFLFVRTRIVQGIFLILPIAVTFWILHWLYRTARDYVIDPIAYFVTEYLLGQEIFRPHERPGEAPVAVLSGGGASGEFSISAGRTPEVVVDPGLPLWMENFVAPLIAFAIVVSVLYFLGMFFQSRLHQAVDWVLLRVPVVTTIYSAVRNVVESLQASKGDQVKRFQRVVLIEFPHPGIRVPAFVTSTCTDIVTGKSILCVYVPTTPVPTSGYMLMIPEEKVVDVDWDLNETLAAIVSGGITTPKQVRYWSDAEAASLSATPAAATPRKVIQGSTPRPPAPADPKPDRK